MIKNGRQYKITKNEIKKFQASLDNFVADKDTHPLLIQAQKSAIEYQLETLEEEVLEYERLKAGFYEVLEVNSFDDLPIAIIRSRIAQNLTQKNLADRLGMKEQLIQKYENTMYSSASFSRLQEIINALDLKIKEDIFLPAAQRAKSLMFDKLNEIGFNKSFIEKRFLGDSTYAFEMDEMLDKLSNIVSNLFGWNKQDILKGVPLVIGKDASMSARFKMPNIKNDSGVTAYTVYAHYIAKLIVQCSSQRDTNINLNDYIEPSSFRDKFFKKYDVLDYKSILSFLSDLGVNIFALDDSGSFHGASWRFNGKNIVVLKQKNKQEARWVFDLLHEFYHCLQNLDKEEFQVIELDETSEERRNSQEEIEANDFAKKVLLGDNAEEIITKCFKKAKGNMAWYKSVVIDVAEEYDIDVGVLALQVAYNLHQMNKNWWGAATSLQHKKEDIVSITTENIKKTINFEGLEELDKNILQFALSE
jgi:transcriptional regulator with XRE-family HTH domain/Zn-dependent peptidase ImmA (M78 family)